MQCIWLQINGDSLRPACLGMQQGLSGMLLEVTYPLFSPVVLEMGIDCTVAYRLSLGDTASDECIVCKPSVIGMIVLD
eukprot:12278148-Ditylum_brightwellii.AAC.1